MHRIFPVLLLGVVLMLLAALVIGLSLGDVRDAGDTTTQRWATVHRLTGLAAAVAVMFLNGVVVTYFIGTSRWCREVVETYNLDAALAARSAALKRRAFPVTLAMMLVIVGVVALGGASDPAAALQPPPLDVLGGVSWATLHLAGAMLGLAFLLYVAYFQWTCIFANQQVIGEILEQVRDIRAARGLDIEEQPVTPSAGSAQSDE